MDENNDIITLTAEIVSSYLSNNSIQGSDINSNLAAMSMQTCVGVFITLLHQGNIGDSEFSTVLEIGRTIRHFASCRTLRQLLLSQAI